MANEAYVKISEVLKDAPALASAATPYLVAGAIKAKYGDFDPTYFTSRKEFLKKYTCDGKLSGKCDISVINAYEVLGSAPILVARAASKEYKAAGLGLDTNAYTGEFQDEFGGVVAAFDIKFLDYMKDSDYQIQYDIRKSDENPGAVKLKVVYERIIDLYRYTLGAIQTGGTALSVGDILTMKGGTHTTTTIKVKVTAIDSEGVPTELKLVTSIGATSETQFVADSGLTVEVTSEKLDNEKVKEYEVLFALDENVTDSSGNSLYYKNVWDDSYPFKVEVGDRIPQEVSVANPYVATDPTQPEILTYLDYGPATPVTGILLSTIEGETSDVNDPVNDPSGIHWDKFAAYEDRQIPQFIDFGTPNIGSQLKALADQFHGMYLNSLPRSAESVAGATNWNDLDLGNSRRYAITPFALTTHLGFLAPIAPTTQYVKTLCNNAQAGKEFEAVAGSSTGVVSYANLTKKYDKKERERLLDLKINTITYREVDGFAMINDDLTGLVQNNPFKEEFNRRLGVRIAQDIDTLMKQFLFQLNTPAYRDTIKSVIDNYFDVSSFKDKIYAYEVICDDSNNPASLQAQNKLAITVNISFYYTAKYIEVLNNIYSVGQSFSE